MVHFLIRKWYTFKLAYTAMFARENRARERYNKCRVKGLVQEEGCYFMEK